MADAEALKKVLNWCRDQSGLLVYCLRAKVNLMEHSENTRLKLPQSMRSNQIDDRVVSGSPLWVAEAESMRRVTRMKAV